MEGKEGERGPGGFGGGGGGEVVEGCCFASVGLSVFTVGGGVGQGILTASGMHGKLASGSKRAHAQGRI